MIVTISLESGVWCLYLYIKSAKISVPQNEVDTDCSKNQMVLCLFGFSEVFLSWCEVVPADVSLTPSLY